MTSPSHPGFVRLGVAGIGNMGSYHAGALLDGAIPECKLAAVCDTDPGRTKIHPDVPGFADSREMIRSGLIDAILIATPHFSHTPVGIDALQAGLHVLIEKPLSVHKADCLRLLSAHRRKDQVFAIMFNQRTDPYYQKVRELVHGGGLGAVRRIQWTITDWFRTEAYYSSSPWRATWAGEGGGVLLNQCVHNIDLFQWIFGMPKKVRSLCQFGRHHDIEVEDAVSAIFEFENGTTATFVTSTGEAPGSNRLEVAGENGNLTLDGNRLTFQRNEIAASKFSRTSSEYYQRPPCWNVEIPMSGDRGRQHIGVLRNFVRAILHGEPLLAPAEDGIRSVELLNAILMASLQDKTIEIPISASAFERLLKKLIAGSKPVNRKISRSPRRAATHDFGAASRKLINSKS